MKTINNGTVTVYKSNISGFTLGGFAQSIPCGAIVLGPETLSNIEQAENTCSGGLISPGDHVPSGFPNSTATLKIREGANIYWVDQASFDTYLTSCNACCTPLPQLAIPLNYTASNGDTQSVQNWDDVPNAINYIVQRALNNSFTGAVQVYSGVVSGFTNTGLVNGTPYYYRVKATAPNYQDSDWAIAVVVPAP